MMEATDYITSDAAQHRYAQQAHYYQTRALRRMSVGIAMEHIVLDGALHGEVGEVMDDEW